MARQSMPVQSGPSVTVRRQDPRAPAVASLVDPLVVVDLFQGLLRTLQHTLIHVVRFRGLRVDRLAHGQAHQREEQLYKKTQANVFSIQFTDTEFVSLK